MASKKKKIRITICIAIILCFFIATIVFFILLKRAGTDITDFLKIGMGWSIVWAMIIHFSLQKLVFKKMQSKRKLKKIIIKKRKPLQSGMTER